MDNWTDDQWYEEFLDIMFTEWTADEMGYAHHAQIAAIRKDETDGIS